ncbi:MAG: ATP-binding protein [Clostridium sp.]
MLDRILHHPHIVSINGKSYHLKDHFKQKYEQKKFHF